MIVVSSTARKREPHDVYPTPLNHVQACLSLLDGFTPAAVLDPGAGDGIWGQEARRRWPRAALQGVELRDVAPVREYQGWVIGDFLSVWLPGPYDLVCGNPPYKHAEAFIRRGLSLLRPGGQLVFLLRLNFLEGQARYRGLWREFPPATVGVFANRPSFTGDGKVDATAYAAYRWVKGERGSTELRFLHSEVDG